MLGDRPHRGLTDYRTVLRIFVWLPSWNVSAWFDLAPDFLEHLSCLEPASQAWLLSLLRGSSVCYLHIVPHDPDLKFAELLTYLWFPEVAPWLDHCHTLSEDPSAEESILKKPSKMLASKLMNPLQNKRRFSRNKAAGGAAHSAEVEVREEPVWFKIEAFVMGERKLPAPTINNEYCHWPGVKRPLLLYTVGKNAAKQT